MNVIDLYVNLIDEKEANKILSVFNDNMKGNNVQLKRMKVAKILKGLNMKISNKQKLSPFDFVLKQHYNKKFEGLSEKQFFLLIRDTCTDEIPPYEKLANALMLFPEKMNELISQMEQNIKDGKDLFKLGYEFKSEEEAYEYMVATSMYSDHKTMPAFVDGLAEYIEKDELARIKELETEIIDWNILGLFNNISEKKINLPAYILQYAFLKTHLNLREDIKFHLIIDIMIKLLDNNHKVFGELSKKMNNVNATDISNNPLMSNMEKEVESLKKNIEKIQKEKKEQQKLNKKGKEKLLSQESKIIEYEDKIMELNNTIKNKDTDFQHVLDTMEKESKEKLEQVNKEKRETIIRVSEIENYLKYTFESGEDIKPTFALVHASEVRIAKMIYPEVLFISTSSFEKEIKDQCMEDIKEIFIQREGLCSSQIEKIKKDAKNLNIETKIISAGNEKKLIEKLANI